MDSLGLRMKIEKYILFYPALVIQTNHRLVDLCTCLAQNILATTYQLPGNHPQHPSIIAAIFFNVKVKYTQTSGFTFSVVP